jgi:hypothetical protein
LTTPFVRSYWEHAMSKWCQYATYDINVNFHKKMSIYLQKTITYTRKSGKGRQE